MKRRETFHGHPLSFYPPKVVKRHPLKNRIAWPFRQVFVFWNLWNDSGGLQYGQRFFHQTSLTRAGRAAKPGKICRNFRQSCRIKERGQSPPFSSSSRVNFSFVQSSFSMLPRCFKALFLSVRSLFVENFLGVRSGFDGVFSWFPLGSFCREVQNPVSVLLGFMPPGAGEQLPDSL